MFRISNTVVGALNVLSLLLGVAAVGAAAYIHVRGGSECQRVVQHPLLIGGALVVVVSALGIAGSLWRVNVALYAYLLVTLLLIVGLAFFTVFVLFVTNRKVAQQISGKGYGEYRVADFSHWLQRYVVNNRNWEEVKSCLVDAHVCENVILKQLSSTQSGCCKPPAHCGFVTKNGTFWEGGVGNSSDSDCAAWSNKKDKLCYDCNSCKAGVLANIRNQWRRLTIFNACLLLLVTAIYAFGCYAIRNNRSRSRSNNRKPCP